MKDSLKNRPQQAAHFRHNHLAQLHTKDGDPMLIEGIKLMLVGMTTVLLFLTFTIFMVQLVSALTRNIAQRELEAINLERQQQRLARTTASNTTPGEGTTEYEDEEDDIAVIAAAVAAYETEMARG